MIGCLSRQQSAWDTDRSRASGVGALPDNTDGAFLPFGGNKNAPTGVKRDDGRGRCSVRHENPAPGLRDGPGGVGHGVRGNLMSDRTSNEAKHQRSRKARQALSGRGLEFLEERALLNASLASLPAV